MNSQSTLAGLLNKQQTMLTLIVAIAFGLLFLNSNNTVITELVEYAEAYKSHCLLFCTYVGAAVVSLTIYVFVSELISALMS